MTFMPALIVMTLLGFATGMSLVYLNVYLNIRRNYRNEAIAWTALEARLEALERRMANLEALVLDDARDKRFEALHNE